MKTIFIKDCKKGDLLTSEVFAIYEVQRLEDKNGKPYYNLTIGDKTGRLKAKIWSDGLIKIDQKILKEGKLIAVDGKIDEYKGTLQITINNAVNVNETAMDDFIESSEYNADEMFNELMLEVDQIKDGDLRSVIKEILNTEEVSTKLKYWPAASSIHHDFRSGLLQHILEMIAISKSMHRFYPDADYDVLISGIVLHDIGKLEELDASSISTTYSKKGSLLGHIAIGQMLFTKHAEGKLDEDTYLHVSHLILSHHGSLEFGSPVVPATIEAFMLTYIDDLSAKPRSAMSFIKAIPDSDEFSNYNRWLENARLWSGPLRKMQNQSSVANVQEEKPDNYKDDSDYNGAVQIPLV